MHGVWYLLSWLAVGIENIACSAAVRIGEHKPCGAVPVELSLVYALFHT